MKYLLRILLIYSVMIVSSCGTTRQTTASTTGGRPNDKCDYEKSYSHSNTFDYGANRR